jgi:hypothetical protein
MFLQDETSETWNQEPTTLAMKQILSDKNSNQELRVNLLILIQVFKHRNIVHARGIHWLMNAVLIFIEPAKCNLYDLMTIYCTSSAGERSSRKKRLYKIYEITDALAQLYEHLEDDSEAVHFMHSYSTFP